MGPDPVREQVQQKPIMSKQSIKLVKSASRGVSRDMSPSAGSQDSWTSSNSGDEASGRRRRRLKRNNEEQARPVVRAEEDVMRMISKLRRQQKQRVSSLRGTALSFCTAFLS